MNLVPHAEGLLGEFVAAGLLGPADIHTAVRLSELFAETDETVALALALAVRALRGGSVCLDLATVTTMTLDREDTDDEVAIATADLPWPEPAAWRQALQASPMVTVGANGPGVRPLRLVDGLLYLERYWGQESRVRQQWRARHELPTGAIDLAEVEKTLDALFPPGVMPDGAPDDQRLAAAVAALSPVCVVAGGPGTGKTTTVAKLLALLTSLPGKPPTIALAAPTGKAAARLEESVRRSAAALGAPWAERIGDRRATTLHRLLGGFRRPFRHNATNPLPHDIVVVDEMSMVSLSMMAELLEAVRPDARLILVGDPDQLASVEAGAVLADLTRAAGHAHPTRADRLRQLCPDQDATAAATGVVTLRHTWRFNGDIADLAEAIRDGDAEAAFAVLDRPSTSVVFSDIDLSQPDAAAAQAVERLRERMVETAAELRRTALAGDVAGALAALDSHRVLCAHRTGPFGVATWGRRVEEWAREAVPDYGAEGEWYAGLPIIINANDPDAGLYNGDTGVIVSTAAGMRGAFARGGEPTLYSTLQLDQSSPVHAMTVHKSQGSQFHSLTFIAPGIDSPLLTRELLYTAVTRASERVEILGTREALRLAIERPANRASGLARVL